jgi:hypothetical protein
MKLWKIQKFAGDVVYDLRQRGLLPVVVLLLVGMVVVPLLITRGGSKSSPSASEAVLAQAAELAPENQKAVVAYQPGVRDYKDRLKELTAKDPFKQQFTQVAAAASQLDTTLAPTGGGASTAPTTTGSTGDDGGESGSVTTKPDTGGSTDTGGGGRGGGGGSVKTKTRYFYYTTDLLVGEAAWTLQRRDGVKALTPLPSETVPVAIYLGATLDGKRALFLLSDQVTQVSGPGQCLPSPTDCSMLALREGESEDLLYGADGKIYRIKVLRNRRVVSSKPPGG